MTGCTTGQYKCLKSCEIGWQFRLLWLTWKSIKTKLRSFQNGFSFFKGWLQPSTQSYLLGVPASVENVNWILGIRLRLLNNHFLTYHFLVKTGIYIYIVYLFSAYNVGKLYGVTYFSMVGQHTNHRLNAFIILVKYSRLISF